MQKSTTSVASSDEIELTSEHIEQSHKVIDRAFKTWHYYAHDIYNSQISLVKNYLWLSVVELTALCGLFDRYQSNFDGCSVITFIFSVFSALTVIVLGILCLCGVFMPKRSYPEENTIFKSVMAQVLNHGPNSDQHYNCLYNVIDYYDNAISSVINNISTRSKFMHLQCYLVLGSLFFGLISFVLLFMEGFQ